MRCVDSLRPALFHRSRVHSAYATEASPSNEPVPLLGLISRVRPRSRSLRSANISDVIIGRCGTFADFCVSTSVLGAWRISFLRQTTRNARKFWSYSLSNWPIAFRFGFTGFLWWRRFRRVVIWRFFLGHNGRSDVTLLCSCFVAGLVRSYWWDNENLSRWICYKNTTMLQG